MLNVKLRKVFFEDSEVHQAEKSFYLSYFRSRNMLIENYFRVKRSIEDDGLSFSYSSQM